MKKFFIALTVLFSLTFFVVAEEGMWLLNQLKGLDLAKKGIKIDVSDIYSPDKPCIADTVVLLGGGTGEFVSPNGLVLTNHHVAFGAVQRASTGGTDYMTNGFLAKSLEQEFEAPGYTAQILIKMKDVTAQFTKFDKIKDLVKRQRAIDAQIKKMEDKIKKGKNDINPRISSMYHGKQYILFVNKRYDDVRVVYVPPMAVGNFGGEIDNWMWPRHTGDFSFMRVYMAPDGSGRKYHKENVPFKPKNYLKLPTEPLKDGDPTFIIGYPGRTTRYRTSFSVRENLEYTYPNRIKLFKEIIELNEKFGKDSKIAKMKTAGIIKGLSNGLKNYQGNVEGMKKIGFIEKKLQIEKELTAFLKKDEKLFKKYGHILDEMKALTEKSTKTRDRNNVFGLFGRLSGTVSGTAMTIYNNAREREKPKKLRDPNFSESDYARQISRLKYRFLSLYEPADKAMLAKALNMASKLSEGQRINGLDYILKDGSIDKFVEEAYKKTKFKDVKYVQSLAKKKVKELEALNDPFINMAKSIYKENDDFQTESRKLGAERQELRKQYIQALHAWKGKTLYPDANRTIRFSFGVVDGYSPKDAVNYKSMTYLKGAIEKDTGKEPFNVPAKLKELYKSKDYGQWIDPQTKEVPIAFTHKVDSTGGNSGSPVINKNGEIVGILFDGNYEAMIGDWYHEEAIKRSISVDIRYVMFIVEKLGNADNILKEMGVK